MAAALGDLLFRDSAVWKRLAGNTTATRKFLAQTGTGAVSAAPVLIQPDLADLTGLGSGVSTFLATPTSANLRGALTDETGGGAAVFATGPTLSAPVMTSLVSGGATVTFPAATGTVPVIIKSSGTASSTTNSASEANLVAVLIPGGIMGTNGSLIIEVFWKFVGTAGTRNARIRHSTSSGDTSTGTIVTDTGTAGATTLSFFQYKQFWNSNNASAQIFLPNSGLPNGLGGSTTTPATGAINTGSDSYLNFNASVVNSGDTAQVVGYTVTLYPGV